ncbi:hypothetical protein CFOL_v3_07179, partial [Cephalotus follicularis]
QENIPTTDSMKAAHCVVAVECAAKYLGVSAGGKGKYFDAVKKIWRDKIGTLEESDESELLSDELKKWREVTEEAVLDVKISEKLLEKNTRNDALMGVMAYLGEAWAILGPTFLEMATRVKKKLKKTGNDSVPEGPGDAPKSDLVQEMENESVPEGPGDETVSNLDICFKCGQAGNWKKNCSEFLQLKAKGMPFIFMVEINMLLISLFLLFGET